ncbi:MAG TPA: hypothetical protein VMW63_03525 [Methanoregulaceae archaeon]|nr:hypothetical protein [Methanoregulaceae archaeon]
MFNNAAVRWSACSLSFQAHRPNIRDAFITKIIIFPGGRHADVGNFWFLAATLTGCPPMANEDQNTFQPSRALITSRLMQLSPPSPGLLLGNGFLPDCQYFFGGIRSLACRLDVDRLIFWHYLFHSITK